MIQNQKDVICREHGLETKWEDDGRQFVWEACSQKLDDGTVKDASSWKEITEFTRRDLHNWLGY